jgi:hypothetical protein
MVGRGSGCFDEIRDPVHGICHTITAILALSPLTGSGMHSRKLQAVLSSAIFVVIAKVYEFFADKPVSALRVALWSTLGVITYIGLSHAFGFDPHRTRLARFAPELQHYIDRWELRLGQATLAMLGCVVLAARFIDNENFVTAVVSGTLAAWTYFVLRLYTGGYKATAHGSN